MGMPAFDNNDFEIKYNKYSKLIFKTAYQYVLNFETAEDIVQEVFIKLFIRKKEFNGEDHEKAWLIRVTINQCKNHLSKKSSKDVGLNEEIVSDSVSLEEKSEQQIDMERELNKLTEDQRICTYLYYYEGYKVREISQILKMKESTVKSVLSRARQVLKNSLNEEDDYELQ